MPPIVLLTDFGHRDAYVGVMKGVIAGINPQARVIDLSHDLPPQDLQAARFVLWNSYRYFPQGSIFVCVVDPGVGSERAIVAVATERYYFVAPDNGLLDYVIAEQNNYRVRKVENQQYFRGAISQTFHGRDIFSPVGAHLSAGVSFELLGPEAVLAQAKSPFLGLNALTETPLPILHRDHFGNLITNLKLADGETLSVWVNGETVPFVRAYAEVEPGEMLAIRGSHGLLEVAVREGSAAQHRGGKTEIRVQRG
jgi:S-adenosylmethionine hydrolase